MGNFHLFILSHVPQRLEKNILNPGDNQQKKGKKNKEITHFYYKESNS